MSQQNKIETATLSEIKTEENDIDEDQYYVWIDFMFDLLSKHPEIILENHFIEFEQDRRFLVIYEEKDRYHQSNECLGQTFKSKEELQSAINQMLFLGWKRTIHQKHLLKERLIKLHA